MLRPLRERRPGRPLDPHRRRACRGHARARAKRRDCSPRRGTPGVSRCSTARPARAASAAWCSSPRSSPRSGATLDAIAAACARGARDARHLVLPRHARVPAPRRAHRRGAGDGRNRAEDQADPHVRHRDRAGGPRAHARARARADGRLPARAARSRRDATGSSSTPRRRPTPSDSSPRAARIFGATPLFCTEVGPVLGAHLGSGMLVGGMTRALSATDG